MADPEVAAIFEWDVATWSQALELWERHLPADLSGCRGLEIGARNGGLSLYLARKGASVVCSDVKNPHDRAVLVHRHWDEAHRIEYAAADATALPFGDRSFDVVAFKSVLGALTTVERQRTAMAEIQRVLKPGGWAVWAENLEASRLHRLLRRRFAPWATYWRYPSLDDWRGWTAGFGESHLVTAGISAALGRTEAQRRRLARVDRLLERVCPRSWHYVVFGAARR